MKTTVVALHEALSPVMFSQIARKSHDLHWQGQHNCLIDRSADCWMKLQKSGADLVFSKSVRKEYCIISQGRIQRNTNLQTFPTTQVFSTREQQSFFDARALAIILTKIIISLFDGAQAMLH